MVLMCLKVKAAAIKVSPPQDASEADASEVIIPAEKPEICIGEFILKFDATAIMLSEIIEKYPNWFGLLKKPVARLPE